MLAQFGESLAEKGWIPDFVIRKAIRTRLGALLQELREPTQELQIKKKMDYVRKLKESPIALHTQEANVQHYEVPTDFFQVVLGKHMKYSSCYYKTPATTREEAEADMLALTCERAQIEDGMSILDVGCGWGSFSLFAAARYPKSSITSISNSATQRQYIEGEAKKRGLTNIQVITHNIVDFDTQQRYDRIVSVEMFEHMKNYEKLLGKVSTWLSTEGQLFVHIFTHKEHAYDFQPGHWMADNFFSGGTMPSDDLLLHFQKDVYLVNHWVLNGSHYQRTLEDWLLRMDNKENQAAIRSIFSKVYGSANVDTWIMKWRMFFLACAELFGYNAGNEWQVSHYLFKKK